MPNTLAHIGAQAWLMRGAIRGADLKWIYIGCVIPDIPWIMQRIAMLPVFALDLYDLRLYSAVQASLLFSLILGASLAFLSRHYWRTFAILAMGSTLHLLLDALEVKWGNGVHLFAPLDWQMKNFGLVWPESFPIHALTLIGLVYILVFWRTALLQGMNFRLTRRQIAAAASMLALYLAAPLAFMEATERADSHFVQTLRGHEDRTGLYVELDRARYFPGHNGGTVVHSAGEAFRVEGVEFDHPTTVSVRGEFASHDLIAVSEARPHPTGLRDLPSFLGLALIVMLLIGAAWRTRNHRRNQ